MLIPVYTIVALLNIFAKSQNYNFKPPKNLPYEIRVRRDLINTPRYDENIADVKNGTTAIDLTVQENISNEYRETIQNPLKFKNVILNEEKNTLNKRDSENINSIHKNGKQTGALNLDTLKNRNLTPQETNNAYATGKVFGKIKSLRVFENQTSKKYKSSIDMPKIFNPQHLKVKIAEKRNKRNFGTKGYNEIVNNYNNQNNYNDIYNYRVTEKTTLGKAFNWVKNLVNQHEKYTITNDSASYIPHGTYRASYTEYNNRNNSTITSNYNWKYENNYNPYNISTQKPYTINYYNGKQGYNYTKQHPHHGYTNYAPGQDYNGINPHVNGKYNYNYTTNRNNTDNNINAGYNYNLTSLYNITESNVITTTENKTIFEGCILCGSFGCPTGTTWVGFKCLPIRH